MNYPQYIVRLGELMVVGVTSSTSATPFVDTHANNILPAIIDYAEQRLYRDLDMIETVISPTQALTANLRNVAIPGGLVVLNQINVITPAGAGPDNVGATRNPLRRASTDFLNLIWPAGAATSGSPSIPVFFANRDNLTAIVAPAPDAAYIAEFVGTARPSPLSSTNVTTILTTYLPDLFVIASMVFASGYQKNWSLKSDDPRAPVNWESQYTVNLQSAATEEARKKAQSAGWEPYAPTPIATPPRS